MGQRSHRWWQQCITGSVVGVLLWVTAGMAQQAPPTAPPSLIVGTKEAPPFAMKHADGTWSGISIALWQAIAAELHLTYTWREFDLQGLLTAVEQKTVDAAVAVLTLTADGLLINFSTPPPGGRH